MIYPATVQLVVLTGFVLNRKGAMTGGMSVTPSQLRWGLLIAMLVKTMTILSRLRRVTEAEVAGVRVMTANPLILVSPLTGLGVSKWTNWIGDLVYFQFRHDYFSLLFCIRDVRKPHM